MGCLSLDKIKSKPDDAFEPGEKVDFSNKEMDLIKKMEVGLNTRYV